MEGKKSRPTTVDEYIAGFPEEVQRILSRIREVIKEAAPGAEEKISYGMPGFFLDGGLVWFGAYKHHIGIYPTSTEMEAAIEGLSAYKDEKATLRFPLDRPVPYGLISEVVKFRVSEHRKGQRLAGPLDAEKESKMTEGCCPPGMGDPGVGEPEAGKPIEVAGAKVAAVRPLCPACGQAGKPVGGQTVKALLAVSLMQTTHEPYLFCRTPDCDVVYYSADGEQTFATGQLRERVYQKEPDAEDAPVCYCFGHSRGSIRAEIERTGRSTAVAEITAGTRAGYCACDIRNPQGACCLGNVRELVEQLLPAG